MVSVLVLTPAVTLITPHQQYFTLALLSTRCLIFNLICVVVSSSGLFFDAYYLLGFKVKSYSPAAFIVRNLPVPFTSGEKHTCTQEASSETESPVELFELNCSDLEKKLGWSVCRFMMFGLAFLAGQSYLVMLTPHQFPHLCLHVDHKRSCLCVSH